MVADVDLEVAALSVHHGEVVHQEGGGEPQGGPVVGGGALAFRRHSGTETRTENISLEKYFTKAISFMCRAGSISWNKGGKGDTP